MVKRTHAASLAALLLVSVAILAAGPPVPPAPTTFVTDKAGVLSADVKTRLEDRLERFEGETSNQILVYIEPKIPEGTTLEEYTVTAAQAWRAGQKERKNGAVLFVFPQSRAARIEVGYGLEGALPDIVAGRIVNDEMIPHFKSGDWDGGVAAGVEAILQATKGEYRGAGRRPARAPRRDTGGLPWPLILFLLIFVLPALFRRRGRYWYIGGGGFGSGGFGGWGGGGWGGGGGGGGFSGGGGSFGGGGASGRW